MNETPWELAEAEPFTPETIDSDFNFTVLLWTAIIVMPVLTVLMVL